MPRKKAKSSSAAAPPPPKATPVAVEEKPAPSLEGMESPKENVWEEDLEQLQSPGGADSTPATVVRGIVCGTMAFAIRDNKKVPDESEASHKWSCYVRGPDDYDISTFIKQVVFSLHPSFNNSVRPFKSPPYEIHEEGWGEFDIGIKLHFWPDSQLRPVEFVHQLKLYPNDTAAATQTVSKKPVVNEIYHELIFTEPEPTFAKRLSTKVLGAGNQSALMRYNSDIRAHFRPFDDAEKARAIKKVKKCSDTVMNLTIEMRERLKAVAVETAQLHADIAALGGTPVQPEKPPEPSATTLPKAGVKRASGDGVVSSDTVGVDVKSEPAGRGKRKSKGRKR